NGFLGTFPLAQSASYNPNPGAAPIDFFDSLGNTYNEGFFQLLRRNVEGGPRRGDLSHTTFQTVFGSKGDLGPNWSYDAYYQYGRVDYSQVYSNEFSIVRLNRALNAVTDTRVGSPTFGQVVCRSVIDGTDPNCVPYNVFSGAGGASQAAVNYLSATGFQHGFDSQAVINASVTGDLGDYGFKFPSASEGVKFNAGIEWRRARLDLNTDQEFQTGDLAGQGAPTLPTSGSLKALEFFTETRIPVVQDGFVKDFSVTAGYRRSHYKTSGGNTFNTDTYKFGAEIAPSSDFRIRGAYNRAVRSPNIQELFASNFVGLSGSSDPCSGHTITATEFGCIAQGLAVGSGTPSNPAGQYNALLGGNPNLQPEVAKTWTVGAVIQPSMIDNLAITIDYYNIKIANAIRSFGSDAILADCVTNATATFTPTSCGLVHRNVAGSLWLTSDGFTTNLPGNVGSIKTRGLEFSAAYNHDIGSLGNLSASFLGTKVFAFDVNNGLTTPYNCAGLYGPTCTVGGTTDSTAPLSRWRHKARLTWATPIDVRLSGQWRFVGPVMAETLSSNPSLSGANNFGPGLHIGGQSYFDLVASYVIKNSYTLRFGVNNILDKEPPLVTSGNGARPGSNLCPLPACNGNTYPATYDALGRFMFINATVDF
ncbi:MAG TPA: TonB-dependent receptor, partial [Parvularculaceae bacterium]|nr:TonB-dependent receptor [Parvularculaceae bacterium]